MDISSVISNGAELHSLPCPNFNSSQHRLRVPRGAPDHEVEGSIGGRAECETQSTRRRTGKKIRRHRSNKITNDSRSQMLSSSEWQDSVSSSQMTASTTTLSSFYDDYVLTESTEVIPHDRALGAEMGEKLHRGITRTHSNGGATVVRRSTKTGRKTSLRRLHSETSVGHRLTSRDSGTHRKHHSGFTGHSADEADPEVRRLRSGGRKPLRRYHSESSATGRPSDRIASNNATKSRKSHSHLKAKTKTNLASQRKQKSHNSSHGSSRTRREMQENMDLAPTVPKRSPEPPVAHQGTPIALDSLNREECPTISSQPELSSHAIECASDTKADDNIRIPGADVVEVEDTSIIIDVTLDQDRWVQKDEESSSCGSASDIHEIVGPDSILRRQGSKLISRMKARVRMR